MLSIVHDGNKHASHYMVYGLNILSWIKNEQTSATLTLK